jgi:uncharacterized membrane protein
MKPDKAYNIITSILGVLAIAPLLAPVFAYFKVNILAKAIYLIYSFFCHQFSSRSILLFDYQIAWCARDTGIWLAIFISFLLVKSNFLPRFKWYWLIPFAIPMALDGGIQTIFTIFNLTPAGSVTTEAIYISNNLARFLTGSFFGIGIGWWLAWQVRGEDVDKNYIEFWKFHQNSILNKILKTIFFMVMMLCIYIIIIFLWRITSPLNPPTDWLDSAVKTPATGFFDRRGYGMCPTDATKDPLALDCFLGRK